MQVSLSTGLGMRLLRSSIIISMVLYHLALCVQDGGGGGLCLSQDKLPYSRDYKYPSIIRTPQIQVPI